MSTTTDAAESIVTDGYFCEIPSDPCAIVMFGASGDLAKRKLLPALFDLAIHSCLAPRFRVLGFARTQMSDEQFRSDSGRVPCRRRRRRREASADFLKHLDYFTRRLRRSGILPAAGAASRRDRPEGAPRRKSPLLSGDATRCVSPRHRATGQGRAGEAESEGFVDADHYREAVSATTELRRAS